MVNRFDVYLVNLDAQASKGAKNTRPCVVVSPDEMNHHIASVIIAPISAPNAKYPTRVQTTFLNGQRSVILDQIRAVDKSRLVKKIGVIDMTAQKETLEKLHEMFAE